MALIFCPDCGSSVSDHADKCLKCFYPIKDLTKSELKIEVIKKSSSLIWIGYIMAFLSLFVFPIFFMIFGVIIGIANVTRNEIGHGIAQIILSITFGIMGMFLGILMYS